MAAGHLSVIWCPITKWQELSFLFVFFFFCLILFHLWASSKECAFLFLGSSRRDSCASHTSPWASLIRRKSWLVGREPNGSAERASWWWKEGYFHSSFDSLNVISERVLVMHLFGLEGSGMIFSWPITEHQSVANLKAMYTFDTLETGFVSLLLASPVENVWCAFPNAM